MKYHKGYAVRAYNLLCKPFKTKKHICSDLGISIPQFQEWFQDEETFKEQVEAGLLEGEVQARNILSLLSLQPASSHNTKLLMLLADEVYGIKSDMIEDNMEEPKPVNIIIESE